MKRPWKIAAIVAGVLLLLVLAVPFFINVDSFRPQIEERLSASLGRKVEIGKISASIFSGGAEANNISISDDPAFSDHPFLQASALEISLEWMPLIFSHKIKVTGLTIKKPEIMLLKNSAGKWNYSSMGNSTPKKVSTPSSPAPDFTVSKLEIQDGKIRIGQTRGRKIVNEQVYDKVNLLARNISATSVMPFTLSGQTPGGGVLEVEGQAGPLDAADSSHTPFDAKVTIEHADLGAVGRVDPDSGLGGTLDFDGKFKSDGRHLRSDGKAEATNLRVVKGATPARQPVALDYTSDYALEPETATVNANLHVGNSSANANGTLNARGETTTARLKMTGKNMAVNDIQGLLPALGIVLPSGASLQGGVANMDLTAEGPVDHLVITGPVNISDTKVSGYNLGSKLGTIAVLTGLQPSSDTVIHTFSSNLRVATEGLRADNIVLDIPTLGQLTGNGVVGASNSLDFKMLLKSSSATGGGLLGRVVSATGSQAKGIPFLIQGTTSNPRFLPAIGGLGDSLKALQGQGSGQGQDQGQGLGGVLGDILGKKKKKP